MLHEDMSDGCSALLSKILLFCGPEQPFPCFNPERLHIDAGFDPEYNWLQSKTPTDGAECNVVSALTVCLYF